MDFKTILARPYNIFSLPTGILSALATRKVDSLPQFNPDQNKSDVTSEREPLRPTCLACGVSSFDNVEQQRAHYVLDWHRFNVKRRSMNIEAGKTDYVPVTEQEFEEFTGDILSSISGSETPESDSSSQSDDIATLVDEFERHNIHGKVIAAKGGKRKSVPILWFTNSNVLADGVYLGIYRNVLHHKGDDLSDPIENIKKLQVESNVQPRYWTMLMIGGGHFAGLVLDITLNSKVTSPKEIKVVVHKTFHRYTTRRKQGGSQANNDNAKGKAKSAGASVRRYNESALQDEIRLLLDQWRSMIDQSELVFVRIPSANKGIIYKYDGAVLKKDDSRIRSFPFSTRRPTFSELKRCFIEFTTVKVSQMTEEALQDHEKESENIQRSVKDKPPLDVKENKPVQEITDPIRTGSVISDAVLKLINLTKQGKLELMKNYISKHSLNVLDLLPDTPVAENDISKTPTLLHLASFLGHNDIVEYLLAQNADPTILSAKNMTPYDLAKSKETRNVFRRRMADCQDQWDWTSAHVPSPLTREMEEEQSRKLKEKKQREKDRKKKANANKKEKESISGVQQQQIASDTNNGIRSAERNNNTSSKSEKILGGTTDSLLGISPEMRMRIERERRARAAESRLGINTCTMCKKSLSGLVPFERIDLKFCSTACVRNHRESQE